MPASPDASTLLLKLVRLQGLRANPALNGALGTVTSHDELTGRYAVHIGTGVKMVKAANLVDEVASMTALLRERVESRVVDLDLTKDAYSTVEEASAPELLELISNLNNLPVVDKFDAAEACCTRLVSLASEAWKSGEGMDSALVNPLVCADEPNKLAISSLVAVLGDAVALGVDENLALSDRNMKLAPALKIVMALSEMSNGFCSALQIDGNPMKLLGAMKSIDMQAVMAGEKIDESKLPPEEELDAMINMLDAGVNGSNFKMDASVKWTESPSGLACKHMLAQAGLFEPVGVLLSVPTASATSMPMMPHLKKLCFTAFQNLCFGSDGKYGKGDPALATERRELASSAGAIEALLGYIRTMAHPLPAMAEEGSTPTDRFPYEGVGMLQFSFRALQRVCLGYDEAGDKRRHRAAALGAIPLMIAATAKNYSLELFKSALSTSETIANEEPILKQQWEDAMQAQPAEFQQRVMRDALAARAGGGGAPPECVIA